MYQSVRGLTIRSVDYKEADRILTVLTDTIGLITVQARGARRKGSRLSGACQLFSFSALSLFENHGRYSLNEGEVLQQFPGLSGDLDRLALASYFAEVLGTEAEDAPVHPDILRLALNSLYALSQGLSDNAVIKAAFELRYMGLSGYAPDLSGCAVCGKEPVQPIFALDAGLLHCRKCALPGVTGRQIVLDASVLTAARYILQCDLKKLFSFELPQERMLRLSEFCESYLLKCMERHFRTLDFYKSVGETK